MFKKLIALFIGTLAVSSIGFASEKSDKNYSLVIHGGAGTILKKNITPEIEKSIREALTRSLLAGEKILKAGGTSMDAIVASIKILEDSAHFNAGHGAVFTSEGKNELDASIMDGKTLNAGSIAGVTTIKNPITLARAVMDKSRHVMFIGNGAEVFAKEQGIESVDPSYFYIERRYQQLLRAQGKDKTSAYFSDHRFGTVGAVAIDQHGNIAAGTSTGGMTNKRYGRVGDVPIIGAGTYANNKSCGVSATGHGEYFIRATVARSICALMEYKGLSLQEAADEIVMKQLVEMKGDGGIIAVDNQGNIVYSFNSAGMYRGRVSNKEKPSTGIFKEY